ncbi:MAG TPA: XRE family transcriptional regulator [Candidatus Limnocylindrales bacterium]|jgi:transcriptional regulator with XRE-family HTH domain|nr:XRE family transcriptional regulator [Candidatus Limnocylindrales bacterium]
MGDHLRAARRRRHLSLRDLAGRLGLSPSLISQVETGRARPSVSTLYAIANELDVSLDELLFNDAGRGGRAMETPLSVVSSEGSAAPSRASSGHPVQRADDRKVIRLASGVVWERLTTESVPGIDFLYVTYEVGGASSPEHEFQRHGGHEWGFVISGRLGVTIGFEDHELGPGDSISIDSTVPHRLYNRGTVPVHGIWFVLGRRSLDVPGLSDD